MRSNLDESEVSKLTSSFDTIGGIVILRIPEALADKRHMIGSTILDNIKSARCKLLR
jgi:tRNA (guanine37-N1)-methyltransferase